METLGSRWVEAPGEAGGGDQVLLVPSGIHSIPVWWVLPFTVNSPLFCSPPAPKHPTGLQEPCREPWPAQETQTCNQPFLSLAEPSLWLPGGLILLCVLGVFAVAAAAVSMRRQTL